MHPNQQSSGDFASGDLVWAGKEKLEILPAKRQITLVISSPERGCWQLTRLEDDRWLLRQDRRNQAKDQTDKEKGSSMHQTLL